MTLFLAINHVETVVRCQRRLGLKSGRFNRKRNSSMTNVECRIKEFFLFYLLKKEQSEATSTIRSAEGGSIIIRHFMKCPPIIIKVSSTSTDLIIWNNINRR